MNDLRDNRAKEVRRFAGTTFGAVLLIGLLWWWLGRNPVEGKFAFRWTGSGKQKLAIGFWVYGTVVLLLGFLAPGVLRPLQRGFTLFTNAVRVVVTAISLGFVFYVIFTPVGIFFRLTGRDPLNRKWDDDSETFWVDLGPPRDRDSYEKQF
jgi:hypothetical protein